MRFLKRQALDRRSANNTTLYSDAARANVYVSPIGNGSIVVPSGTNAQRPGTAVNGMLRYNTDAQTNGQLECYSGGRWRALRFVEQGQIIQQNLGAGDGLNLYFGPLNSTYYNTSNNANNATVGAQNIIVVVENVFQVSGINYNIVNSGTIPGETYTGSLSVAATVGTTTLYFNTSIVATGGSGTGTTATITFPAETAVPFAVGSTINVSGAVPTAYNGNFTVTASTTTSVSYASSATGTVTIGPTIISTGVYAAVFPMMDGTVTSSVSGNITTVTAGTNLIGATVTGTNIQASTAVTSFTYDNNTDALLSITINKATVTSTIPVNTQITIIEASQTITGNYLQFTTPVPYGKVVVALLGFDS